MDDLNSNNLDMGTATETETASIEDRLSGYFGQADTDSEETNGVDTNTADDVEIDQSNSDDEQTVTDSEEGDNVETTDEANDEVTTPEPADDFKIKIGDEEITYADLKGGYLRQSDYTRKTQELSGQRAILEQAQLAANQLVQKEVIDNMRLAYQVELMEEPNWADLKENDPFGYPDKREAWDAKMAKFAELQTIERNMHQQRVELENKRFVEMREKAKVEFYNRHPEFNDKTVADTHTEGMAKYLYNLGFSDEEIASIADPRLLTILYSAYKHEKTADKVEYAKKVISNKPKITAPKATGSRPQYTQARNKLRETGSTQDAIDALRNFF